MCRWPQSSLISGGNGSKGQCTLLPECKARYQQVVSNHDVLTYSCNGIYREYSICGRTVVVQWTKQFTVCYLGMYCHNKFDIVIKGRTNIRNQSRLLVASSERIFEY